jgi:hypothetical protein
MLHQPGVVAKIVELKADVAAATVEKPSAATVRRMQPAAQAVGCGSGRVASGPFIGLGREEALRALNEAFVRDVGSFVAHDSEQSLGSCMREYLAHLAELDPSATVGTRPLATSAVARQDGSELSASTTDAAAAADASGGAATTAGAASAQPKGRRFAFPIGGTPFEDTAGVLYWIGTAEGTRSYMNPHKLGEELGGRGGVVAAMSSLGNGTFGYVAHFVGRTGTYNRTDDEPNSWMSVDLGVGRALAVDHYCLRHGYDTARYWLRNWRLEGSNDGALWTVLKPHENDHSFPQALHSVAHWPVAPLPNTGPWAFRHFRIVQHGPTSEGDHYLMCSGIELYGELFTQ